MTDWSKLSLDLQGRLKEIMAGKGENPDAIDHHEEYQELAKLLAGKGKDKIDGDAREFIEGQMADYEEAYMIGKNVKDRVLDIIKHGDANRADDNVEIKELKRYKKTDGLTKTEKTWIQRIIDGRFVKNYVNSTTNEGESHTTDPETEKYVDEKVPDTIKKESDKTRIPEEGLKVVELPENNKESLPEKGSKEIDPPPHTEKEIPPKSSKKNVHPTGMNAKNNVAQNGQVNVNGNNNTTTTVVVNNVPVGFGVNHGVNHGVDHGVNPPNAQPPFTPPYNTNSDKVGETRPTEGMEKEKRLTPSEIKAARDCGEAVAESLLGHTSNTEQRIVQDIVEKEVNSENITEFIKGYEKGRKDDFGIDILPSIAGATGAADLARPRDHVFEQLRTEWDFPEKETLLRKLAKDLKGYLENKYGVNSDIAKEVAVILLEKTLDEDQTRALDKIALKEAQTLDGNPPV